MGRTLAEKVWDDHVVRRAEGEPDLLFIDLHLIHEVTSPQAFDGLRMNGRRVLARAVAGQGQPGPPAAAKDLAAMERLLPADGPRAARFCAAMMELGALVCTAGRPACAGCPVRERCAWRLAGYPAYAGPVSRPQRFAGTDRQVRGLLMAVLRAASGPVGQANLDLAWPDAVQRQRAQDSLIVDGLIDPLPDGRFALPGAR